MDPLDNPEYTTPEHDWIVKTEAALAKEPFNPEDFGFLPNRRFDWYLRQPIVDDRARCRGCGWSISHQIKYDFFEGVGLWTIMANPIILSRSRRRVSRQIRLEPLFVGRIPSKEFARELLLNVGDPNRETSFVFRNTIQAAQDPEGPDTRDWPVLPDGK